MNEWTTVTFSSLVPDVGTGLAVASPNVLSASGSLLGVGEFGVGSWRFGTVLAHESGALSISIPYVITQAVVPNVWVAPPPNASTGSFALTDVSLSLNLLDLEGTRSSVRLDARSGTGSRSGTLLGTIMMSAGEQAEFVLQAGTAARVTSVPEPDMLWSTLIGLVGAALFVEQRRRYTCG
jgi:hypothetical protein